MQTYFLDGRKDGWEDEVAEIVEAPNPKADARVCSADQPSAQLSSLSPVASSSDVKARFRKAAKTPIFASHFNKKKSITTPSAARRKSSQRGDKFDGMSTGAVTDSFADSEDGRSSIGLPVSSTFLDLVPEEGKVHRTTSGSTVPNITTALPTEDNYRATAVMAEPATTFMTIPATFFTASQQDKTTLYTSMEKRHMKHLRWITFFMVPASESRLYKCCQRCCGSVTPCLNDGRKQQPEETAPVLSAAKQRALEDSYFQTKLPKAVRLVRWLLVGVPIIIVIVYGLRFTDDWTETDQWRQQCNAARHTLQQCTDRDSLQRTAFSIICLGIWVPFNIGVLLYSFTAHFARSGKARGCCHAWSYVLFAGVNLSCDIASKFCGGDPGFGTTAMFLILFIMLPTMYPLYLVGAVSVCES